MGTPAAIPASPARERDASRGSRWLRTAASTAAIGIGAAAAVYGALVGTAWFRYGRPSPTTTEQRDLLLERFMPVYEVVERHQIHVGADAGITFSAARELDLQGSAIVRTIIRAREAILGASPAERPAASGLIAEMTAIGWGVLAEVPGREVVVGAVTRPWEPNVTFRALPPDRFAAFNEPGYVKIAWTLRVDPVSGTESIFRTETRAVATDPVARARFRRYWGFFSPGIAVIRWAVLRPVKVEAERRAARRHSQVL